MNQDGYYYLWSGLGAIEDLDDADPLIQTANEAMKALRSKKEGHWTLWYRVGYKAILVAVWMPERNELMTFTIRPSDLEGPP